MNIALMGHGVVGSGVAEILIDHCERIAEKAGEKLFVKYILDLRDFSHLPYGDKFTRNFEDILNDDSVKVVAELMGGVVPAYDFVKKCLLSGKSVVTSNKELVAKHGAELIRIASEKNVNFLFEASVGGGIPILRPMFQCLSANKINSVTGILNGTTNFILNKMIVDNMDFDAALKLAQVNGYAEKDPTADIEGLDAARKICILATVAFGKHVYPQQVLTEGISDITLEDIDAADSLGYVIKLIGHTERLDGGKITAWVRPVLISRDNILASVNGVFNAINVNGDQTGDVMFYGKGAGKNATASAVVADIIDCSKHINARKFVSWEDGNDGYVVNSPDTLCQTFVRIVSNDFDSVEKQITELFGTEIKIIKNQFRKEICFISGKATESTIKEKLGKLSGKVKALRVLE